MNDIRETFLETSRQSLAVISSDALRDAWDSESALREFSVRGLAGHLVRGTGSVEAYLDREEPKGSPISAAAYYAQAVDTFDINSPLHIAVRERGEQQAADGPDALIETLSGTVERLATRLEEEPETRLLRVFKDLVLSLDDYLRTRLVELVIHIDDLCESLVIDSPPVPSEAVESVIETLVGVARYRHGDLAVVRALSRRERDRVEALRVL